MGLWALQVIINWQQTMKRLISEISKKKLFLILNKLLLSFCYGTLLNYSK